MSDSSRLNLVNLHYRVTNHTIITTSTMVVVGCILLISIFAKGYVSHQKKRKRDKRSRERSRERSNHSSRDFTQAFATNGTWHMDQGWMPRQQMAAQGWAPSAVQHQPPHQPPPGAQPQAAPRQQRDDQPSQEMALVHASGRTSNEDTPRLANQWKPTI